LAPIQEATTANDLSQRELAQRVRDVEAAMREVQEGQNTGTPSGDAVPTRETSGTPLVPQTLLEGTNTPYVLSVTRLGIPAPVPGTKAPARDQTRCGWYIERPALRYGSDLILNRAKLGRASPYLLMENGVALRPHAADGSHADRCAGAYRHAGARFEFSPTGYVDAVPERTYTIGYDERIAVPRADGRRLFWVYPGTELVFEFEGQWPNSVPALELVASVKRVGQYNGRASYQVGWAKPKWIRGPTPVIRASVDPNDKGIRFAINSPVDGPLVVVDTLMIATPESAFVVTAEGHTTLLGGK